MDEANPELARQILLDACADPERVVVKEYAFGWLVASREHGAACSSAKDEAFDTPQECAAHLVSRTAGPAATNPTQPAAGPVELFFDESEVGAARTDLGLDSEPDLGQEVLEWEDETGQDDPHGSAYSDTRNSGVGIDLRGAGWGADRNGDDPAIREDGDRLGPDDLTRTDSRRGDAGGERLEALSGSEAYGGIALERLSDELSIRRAQVIDLVSAEEEIRCAALVDPSLWQDLMQAFIVSNNLAPDLWPAGTDEKRRRFMDLSGKERAIRDRAVTLRRSARDANLDILQAMAKSLKEGWPSDG